MSSPLLRFLLAAAVVLATGSPLSALGQYGGETGYQVPESMLADLTVEAASAVARDCALIDGGGADSAQEIGQAAEATLLGAQAAELASVLATNLAMHDYFVAIVEARRAAGETTLGGQKLDTLIGALADRQAAIEALGGRGQLDELVASLRAPGVSEETLATARRTSTGLNAALTGVNQAVRRVFDSGGEPQDMLDVLVDTMSGEDVSIETIDESLEVVLNHELLVDNLAILRQDVAARTLAYLHRSGIADCVTEALLAGPGDADGSGQVVVERSPYGPYNIHGMMTIEAPAAAHSAMLTVYLHGGDDPWVDGAFTIVVPAADFEGYDAIRRGMRTDEMGNVVSADIGADNEIETILRVFPNGEFGNMGAALELVMTGRIVANGENSWTLSGDLLLPVDLASDWAAYLGVSPEAAGGMTIGSWTVDSANRS